MSFIINFYNLLYMKYNRLVEDKKLIEFSYPVGRRITSNISLIRRITRIIMREFPNKGINLIVCGASGATMAGGIAYMTKQISTIIQIRKERETTHAYQRDLNIDTWDGGVNVIVDDLISSGNTMNRIYNEFKRVNPKQKIDAIIVGGGINIDKETLQGIETDLLVAQYIYTY